MPTSVQILLTLEKSVPPLISSRDGRYMHMCIHTHNAHKTRESCVHRARNTRGLPPSFYYRPTSCTHAAQQKNDFVFSKPTHARPQPCLDLLRAAAVGVTLRFLGGGSGGAGTWCLRFSRAIASAASSADAKLPR